MLQTSRRVLLATNTEKYTTLYYYCDRLLVLLGKQGIKFTELNILQFCLILAGFLESMGIIDRASSSPSSYNNRFRVMTKAWMKSSFIYLTSDKKKNIEYTQSTLLNMTMQCCSTGTNLRSGVLFFSFSGERERRTAWWQVILWQALRTGTDAGLFLKRTHFELKPTQII